MYKAQHLPASNCRHCSRTTLAMSIHHFQQLHHWRPLGCNISVSRFSPFSFSSPQLASFRTIISSFRTAYKTFRTATYKPNIPKDTSSMSNQFRSLASKMTQNAAIRASSFIHSRLSSSAQEGEHVPLLPASSEYSQESLMHEATPDFTNGEYKAHAMRPQQRKDWIEEHTQRVKDLASKQILHNAGLRAQGTRVAQYLRRPVPQVIPDIQPNPEHHWVQVLRPLSNVAGSQKAEICFASDDSSGSSPPPMHEQQTGVIREYELGADKSEDEDNGLESRSSSLQRRGAVRRKKNPFADPKSDGEDEANPSGSRSSSRKRRGAVRRKENPFANPKSEEEDEGDRDGSNSSSLRRRGAVKHKKNPVFPRTTQGDFDYFRDHFKGPW
jgi:hypothetical protein